MITEKDMINAWVHWKKVGLMPPDVKDIKEFKASVRTMYTHFKNTNLSVFQAAVLIAGKGHYRWPTILDVELAIEAQERIENG